MAGTTGIRAGAAYIELSVSDSRFVKGLRAASAKLNEFGSGLTALGTGMTAIGGAVTAPLMAAATAFATAGDTLAKASDRTGLSVEALSELSFASQLAGTNFEELETGLKNMQRTLGAAFAGTGTVAEKLTVLGLSVEKLSGLSPEAQFEAIAKAISRVADPTVRAAAAVDIFGRNGTKLIPLMQNLQALRGEARSLGLGWTTKDAVAAAELQDAMTRVWAVAKRLVETIGGALAPVLTDWGNILAGLLAGVRQWISDNARLIVSLAVAGGAVMAAGAAVIALGLALKAVGAALGAIAGLAAAILSPWMALGAAVVALGGYLTWTSGVGSKAVRWLSDRFGELYDAAAYAFQGIKDAMSAGNIALAGRIFWSALSVAWQTGINTLRGYWLDFKAWFFRQTDAMFTGAAAIAIDAWIGVARIWTRIMLTMQEVSDAFVSGFGRAWNDLGTWVAKRWATVLGLLDSTIDVADVQRRLESEGQRRNIEIAHRSANITIGGLEKIRALETDRQRMLASVANMADQDAKEREAGYESERQAAEESLKAAKESLRMAVEEARLAAEKTCAERAGRIGAAAEFEPGEAPGAPAVALSRATLDIAGAFAGAFERLGLGGSALDRTAAATEETARNTRRIAQKMDAGVLAFE